MKNKLWLILFFMYSYCNSGLLSHYVAYKMGQNSASKVTIVENKCNYDSLNIVVENLKYEIDSLKFEIKLLENTKKSTKDGKNDKKTRAH